MNNMERWEKHINEKNKMIKENILKIDKMNITLEEKKARVDRLFQQVKQLGDVKRREEIEKRKEKMDFDVSEGLYSIKSGVPVIIGKYDFSRPDCFYFEYVNMLNEFNQDWQIGEYEKLTKKVWKILTRYYVSYINDGYDKRKERAKQEILTGLYRRMFILCMYKDMTLDEYINLSEGEISNMTFELIYEYTLHDFKLSDVMGYNIEEMRKLRFNTQYL